ncbi:hypothetical protein J2Y58_003602 [Sphingomonas sp. BE138]|uniref:hypothetical protein n=1 Tax=Sphingomonas sp. BE138 TaxID=2817845 RepID=UPI00285474E7|nr:hypothetical protein [Sphingomonas sp. BE138]MDR6790222.1 hypothetical protein [Sphingomonas sp. BE138]
MTTTPFRERFDLDITLRDAALDSENRPTRRMIANASIGMHVEDAYYSVRELREAVSWVHEGIPAGKGKLSEILANDGADDFQRCVYFCLAGRGVVAMLDDLEWLEDLLERRGRVAGEQARLKATRMPLTNPYVADAPDGPIVKLDAAFEQGPSWWTDPTLSV